MATTRFIRANKAATAKARKLGYKGLLDLDTNGTKEHKGIVKTVFDSTK